MTDNTGMYLNSLLEHIESLEVELRLGNLARKELEEEVRKYKSIIFRADTEENARLRKALRDLQYWTATSSWLTSEAQWETEKIARVLAGESPESIDLEEQENWDEDAKEYMRKNREKWEQENP